MPDKPAPVPNADTKAFWQACNRESLMYQICRNCGYRQFYPRKICKQCASEDLAWEEAAKRGTVHSFTTQYRAPTLEFREDVPYIIALIDLEDGIRMMMNIKNCSPEDVYIGMPVMIGFEERGEERQKIPQAIPA